MKTIGFIAFVAVVSVLIVGGATAIVAGLLWTIWTDEFLGMQVAATGAIALAVGFVVAASTS
jgi:hypothetical protein